MLNVKSMLTRRRVPFARACLCVSLACLSGCVTTKKGPSAAVHIPAGAPPVSEIAADLRANDERLLDFRAATTFTIESPKLKSVQRFTSGTVAYRRPADLYVVGKNNLGAALFKLTSRGPEFLIEFPAVQDVDERYYCSFEADDIANVPFPVAPADVAHEMFQPIDWTKTEESDLRYAGFDAANGEATLTFGVKDNLTRRIVVRGKPWCIAHNTLIDASGATLSDTTMSDYIESNGVRVPATVDADFPSEHTHIRFELRNVRANTGLPDSMFTWTWPPGQ